MHTKLVGRFQQQRQDAKGNVVDVVQPKGCAPCSVGNLQRATLGECGAENKPMLFIQNERGASHH